jgi:hypothetical protein
MTPKDKLIAALHGERTPTVPAGVHGWGMYKFAHAGRLSDYSLEKQMWRIHGRELARIEIDFQEAFRPDFMQLAEAFFESKKQIINDPRNAGLLKAVRSFQSRSVIDELLDRVYDEPDELFERKLGHLRELSQRYGKEVFIISPDMVSPEMYRRMVFPLQLSFYRAVEQMGLVPILCAWGWVTPIARYLREAGIRGLMVEESRKNFTNEVAEIKAELGDRVGLFGNVSGEHTLLHGTVEEVRSEVISQIERAGRRGGFISSSGTPIAFGTPPQNVHALIDTAREYVVSA